MRQLRAVLIVAALVLAVPIVDLVVVRADAAEPGLQEASPVGIDAGSLASLGDPGVALDYLEGLASADDAVPLWLEQDVGLPASARDVRVSGSVASYMLECDSAQAFAIVREHMVSHGWSCVLLGGADGATFVKDGGACTWALVTCTQVDEATCVVIRGNAS